ncbi:hypothetical protein [Zoogloea sp.]|uniref:hypothetical protein n=1 Tax=Zoogloea sp. TaxID=49181 RepID=UPI001DE281F6|nr:hypothetical protein [Zoogloea sp.]MBK6652889.1 hypothetical protein [Zoogloea sp.]
MTTPALPKLRFVAAPDTSPGRKLPLPSAILSPANRGDSNGEVDALLANVAVEMTWEIGLETRGRDTRDEVLQPDKRLLALEADDGLTVFIRADALSDRLDRLADTRPELRRADGSLDLSALRPRDARNRGLGEWVWRKLSTLTLSDDAVIRAAREKMAELTGNALEDLIVAAGSHAGAKAIVWAIEARGRNAPGLYPWDGALSIPTPGFSRTTQTSARSSTNRAWSSFTARARTPWAASASCRAAKAGRRSIRHSRAVCSAMSTTRFPKAPSTMRWRLQPCCLKKHGFPSSPIPAAVSWGICCASTSAPATTNVWPR